MTGVPVLSGDALHGHRHEADVTGHVTVGRDDFCFVLQFVFIVFVRFYALVDGSGVIVDPVLPGGAAHGHRLEADVPDKMWQVV